MYGNKAQSFLLKIARSDQVNQKKKRDRPKIISQMTQSFVLTATRSTESADRGHLFFLFSFYIMRRVYGCFV